MSSDQTITQDIKDALIEQTEIMSNAPIDLKTILMFRNPQDEYANSLSTRKTN